jgi:hypothetical protein
MPDEANPWFRAERRFREPMCEENIKGKLFFSIFAFSSMAL